MDVYFDQIIRGSNGDVVYYSYPISEDRALLNDHGHQQDYIDRINRSFEKFISDFGKMLREYEGER